MDVQHDVLKSLGQCCDITIDHCHQWYMVCYYIYLHVKAVVVEFVMPIKYAKCLLFDVAVPTPYIGQTFAGKCNWT